MAFFRVALAGVLLLTALLIELTALPLFHLPGAVPDLLTVTVVALGFVGGPVRGAASGFVAGLALDLVPPADGVLGMSAVILVVVGFFAGLVGEGGDHSPFTTVAQTGLLAGAGTIGLALLGGLVADPRINWDRVPFLVLTQVAYSVVLAAFVVPAIAALWRLVDPPPPRYDVGRP